MALRRSRFVVDPAIEMGLGSMFNGNSRFKLLRQLGAGGMGVVYEALDQQRNTRVALKTLRETNAELLYRLKREFRGLRDLVHRNLVGLGELFEEDGHWFFTMELLDGEDLRASLHGVAQASAGSKDETMPASSREAGRNNVSAEPGGGPMPPVSAFEATWPRPIAENAGIDRQLQAIDFDRVREVFRQVTEGLLAIHNAGKIHRDIKPSNIIVTRNGRAVILDFGLVTEQWGAGRSADGKIVGTLMYMAPEQATAQAVGPPADWYSVGVMLYEIVTRQRPFAGHWGGVAAKQYTDPRNPKELNSSCPDDLAELCVRLLQFDPLQRPQGPDVLSRLSLGEREESVVAARAPTVSQQRVFVGREHELRELRRAFDDVNAGTSITLFVHGESGIGKSTLIDYFVNAIEGETDETMVLTGQCREHEAVPFKAMDGIIDALSRHVCGLSDVAAAELVPQNAALLPGVFPVLGRIPAIAKAPRPIHVASDPFQQRKRVFTALREMLCLLTERYKLIWVIDDMQWVDSDSLYLLGELLRSPDQPRMLLLASVRSGEEAASLPHVPGEVRRVHLQPLNPEESARLAGMLLDRISPEQRPQTLRIVDETGGHPLFIGELVRYAAADRRAEIKQLRLDEAIWARVSQLDAASLSLLKILSMAVAPLSEEIIHAAVKLDARELQNSITLLRANHLIRSASSTHAWFEVYHDRVRQSVVHHIEDVECIALNERIAVALETSGVHVQPEMLIYHLQGAKQFEKAARKALEAADRAQTGLAFEQASQLYEAALGLATWPEAEKREILIALGGALASAGRGPDAASAYAKAADGADPITELSCRIQMADQLVQSGYLEKGTALLFLLFQEHGHDLPGSQLQITLRIAWYRLRLVVRGLRWTDHHRSEIRPRDLALLALYKAASRGLILVDPVRAAYFVIRGLHLAMDIGDREFAMYFLFMESGFRGSEGREKHMAFLRNADALMENHADPLFQIVYRMVLGVRTYLSIDREFKAASEMLDRSEDELAQTANAAWELSASRFFLISSLHKMGDFVRMRVYSERFVREAEQRGNVYTRTTISRMSNILWLVDDDPRGAREDLRADLWISHAREYHWQHWLELRARIEIAIYEGSSIDQEFFSLHLKGLKESFLQRILDFRCETPWMVGRMALSKASREASQRRIVRRSISKLLSFKQQYPKMLATMLRATLAVQEGDSESAVRYLREVVTMGEMAHISFVTAVARRRLGVLVGGDEGRELVTTGERWMSEAGIRNIDRMTYLVSPCDLDLRAPSDRGRLEG